MSAKCKNHLVNNIYSQPVGGWGDGVAVETAGMAIGTVATVGDYSVVVEVVLYLAFRTDGGAVVAKGETAVAAVAVGAGEVVGAEVAHLSSTYDETSTAELEVFAQCVEIVLGGAYLTLHLNLVAYKPHGGILSVVAYHMLQLSV